MKQNKRFWLVSVALVLALVMVSGLAMAATTYAKVTKVTAGELKNGDFKTSYLFYAYGQTHDADKHEFKDEWEGLFAEGTDTAPTTDTFELKVTLADPQNGGDIQFNYEDNRQHNTQDLDVDENFFFVSNSDYLKVTGTPAKPAAGAKYKPDEFATLKWDGKHTGTFEISVYAANGITEIDDIKNLPSYKAGEGQTFKVEIRPVSVSLKIMNSTKDQATKKADPKGTFNYNIYEDVNDEYRDWTKKTLNLAEEFLETYLDNYQKYDVDPRVAGTTIGFIKESFPNLKITDTGKANGTVLYEAPGLVGAYAPNVLFDLVYDPANLKDDDLDVDFVSHVEDEDLAGYTFTPSGDSVGTFEKIKKYAQDKDIDDYIARPGTYLKWKDKAGTVKVEIAAVDSNAKVLKYIKTATATLNFKENVETKVDITITALNDDNTVKTDDNGKPVTLSEIEVPVKKTYDVFGVDKYYTTRIEIIDENGNGVEPTYANGYADLVWSSSDTSIIRVTKDGQITGIKEGTAYAIATSKNNVIGKVKVVVPGEEKSKITDLKFNQDPPVYEIPCGEDRYIEAYLLTTPSEIAEDYRIRVESSDPDILKVSKITGNTAAVYNYYGKPVINPWKLEAEKIGEVTVTVTAIGTNISKTATFRVIQRAEGIAFAKDSYKVNKGDSVKLYVKMKPVDAAFRYDNYDVSVEDEAIVSVSQGSGSSEKDNKYIYAYGKKIGSTKVTLTNKYDKNNTATVTVVVEGVKAESIKLKKDSVKLYFEDTKKSGDKSDAVASTSYSFKNNVVFKPGAAENDEDAWEFDTDDTAVAIVTNTGIVVPTGVGTTVITGIYDDGLNKAELKLTVNVVGTTKADPEPEPEPAKSNPIIVEPEDGNYYINVVKGAKNTMQLIAYDAVTGEEVDVKWSSKDTKMATVSKTGLVKAKGKGRVTITATTLDGTQKYNIGLTLNQKPVEKIIVDKKAELKAGEKYIIVATVYPKHAYNQELSAKSSDKKVVAVDGGILIAKKPGTAIVTISAKDGSGVKATVEVTVVK